MTWLTEANAPATSEQIEAAERALGVPIPDLLKALYARHDGLMIFLREHVEAGDPGDPAVHLFGVAAENLCTDGLLADPADGEFLDYVREHHGPGVIPLVFETTSFGEWLEEVCDTDFPSNWLCIAANIQSHDSFWVPARSDADTVCQLPSPRFAVEADVRAALKVSRPLKRWLSEVFSLV